MCFMLVVCFNVFYVPCVDIKVSVFYCNTFQAGPGITNMVKDLTIKPSMCERSFPHK